MGRTRLIDPSSLEPSPSFPPTPWLHGLTDEADSRTGRTVREIIAHYENLAVQGVTPCTMIDREHFASVKQTVTDFVYLALDKTRIRASAHGALTSVPCVSRISIREEFFRIRMQAGFQEYCLLAHVQDLLGRSIVFSEDGLAYPTRNPMLLFIKAGPECALTFSFDALFSRSAFLEELEVVRLALDPFRRSTREKALLPVTYVAIERAARGACGDSCGPDAKIENISVIDRGLKEIPSFLVELRGEGDSLRRCLVRFSFSADLPFPITRTTLIDPE